MFNNRPVDRWAQRQRESVSGALDTLVGNSRQWRDLIKRRPARARRFLDAVFRAQFASFGAYDAGAIASALRKLEQDGVADDLQGALSKRKTRRLFFSLCTVSDQDRANYPHAQLGNLLGKIASAVPFPSSRRRMADIGLGGQPWNSVDFLHFLPKWVYHGYNPVGVHPSAHPFMGRVSLRIGYNVIAHRLPLERYGIVKMTNLLHNLPAGAHMRGISNAASGLVEGGLLVLGRQAVNLSTVPGGVLDTDFGRLAPFDTISTLYIKHRGSLWQVNPQQFLVYLQARNFSPGTRGKGYREYNDWLGHYLPGNAIKLPEQAPEEQFPLRHSERLVGILSANPKGLTLAEVAKHFEPHVLPSSEGLEIMARLHASNSGTPPGLLRSAARRTAAYELRKALRDGSVVRERKGKPNTYSLSSR